MKLLALLGIVATGIAADWSAPAEVRHDTQLCVTYRARIAGSYLVVEATHQPGWHTYAMDNKLRAQEKLAGKKSLGIDAPTEIKVSEGLEIAGPWLQTEPKELSKPEIRWFTWGYDGKALFAAKAKSARAGRVAIRGQSCSDTTCKNIDVELVLRAGKAGSDPAEIKGLIPVR